MLVSTKPNHYGFAKRELDYLRSCDLYRSLNTDNSLKGSVRIRHNNQSNILNFSSNDYMGISTMKEVIKSTKKSLRQISPCSSRLITGNTPELERLEDMLAIHRNTKTALVFPTGYVANIGTITVLGGKNSVIFSDELNHASIIDGCRLSGAEIRIFRHNDVHDLEQKIKQARGSPRKIVVTEGVFSMDGDFANLKEICDICHSHDALLVVDDAHGDFIFGNPRDRSFSGVPSYFGVNSRVDFHISSLSKALGCFGGYVATSRQMRELLINRSKQFIYTSSIPSHLCVSAMTAMEIAENGHLQHKLFRNIDFLGRELCKMGLIADQPHTQIIPILVGSEKNAVRFSELVLKKGILTQPIRFPTVKKGCARIRISISALHTRVNILIAVDAIRYAAAKLKLI
jgi:glycine C-acetyltransferase